MMPTADRNCIVAMARKYPPREFEDLLQEAEIAYWQATLKYDASYQVTLRTYAMQRAKGALIDWLRRTDFRPRFSTAEPIILPGELPEAVSRDNPERSALLHAALSKLTAEERREVLLYYCHGLKLREIGALAGRNESATCMRMKRATLKLRSVLCGLQ